MTQSSQPVENTCLQCGTATTNPRFCNRSCAATYNNRHSPKRSPEGRCADCGTTIPIRHKRCESCATRAEEARRRAELNT